MPEPVVFDIAAGAPPTLDHVIGGAMVVRQIRTALNAHFNDRALVHINAQPPVFPHVLLVGPAGLGKSMLAGVISRELGGELHEELAQNLSVPASLHGLLMILDEPESCLFVDEIHEMPLLVQTTLYRALEECKLFLSTRGSNERQSITIPPFTLIAATTDEHALSKPLRDRFKMILRLEYYSPEELAQLLHQRAQRLGWDVTEAALKEIAMRGRGVPRLGIRILEFSRRTARALNETEVTASIVVLACGIEQIDSLGLDSLEQRYLQILNEAADGPLRLNIIATRLGLPTRTIEKIVESDLIRIGLVTKDDRGRILTGAGREHIKQTEAAKK